MLRGARTTAGVLATVLVLAATSACSGNSTNKRAAAATITSASSDAVPVGTADTLPDVLLSDLDGNAIPMRSLASGTVTVLNYWYATCPPCKEEMPALGTVAKEFTGRVTFIGINPQDDAATAQAVATERGTPYRQLLDSTQRSVDALRLTGFPTTLVVRADGTIAQSVRRAITADELRTILNEVLAA